MKQFFSFFFFLICFAQSSTMLFAQLDSTNLPIVMIDTQGRQIVDEPKVEATMKIIYSGEGFNHKTDLANIYDGKIGIEIRGKYSASLPQLPYGLETRDQNGENLNVPLFHMPEENDWILLANYNDKTFMRNSLTFELFRKMGHYAPRTQFCEVMLNGTYQGIYVFTEKIKKDKGRVDIAGLNSDENTGDDLTGGYIIKVDYYDESNSWQSAFRPIDGNYDDKVYFVYEYPKVAEISVEQRRYIQDFINAFETQLYASNSSQQKLSRYIDINSFVDYFILNELARNVDGYKKSAFFHKDKDSDGGLLHAGPVWDFDWAWKNINECYFGATDGSGWAYKVHQCNPWPVPPSWMNRLLMYPEFSGLVNERYFSLRETYLSENYIFQYVDSVAQLLDGAQKRHYSRWRILGINVGAPEVDAQPTTYEGEIVKFKDWISKRLNWLDANMPNTIVTGFPAFVKQGNTNVFPNPTNAQITISSEQKITTVSISSLDGKSIYSSNSQMSEQVDMDISALSEGLYIVKAKLDDGSFWTGKLMKKD